MRSLRSGRRKVLDRDRTIGGCLVGGAMGKEGSKGLTTGRSSVTDVPFELVGKVASACPMAEAGDIEGGTAGARHFPLEYGSKDSQPMYMSE